ncbi:hypothetical protein D0T84_03875 [Dysgonomonas sp. 521]|uniref:hypothetical protein n=1 Tax=Dysgonomonas sp. 521 TaxID=2302932 RepID=UPI0013D6AE71|nr:hypothetical protein [Dysgonomonas sp. 521]NDV94057.1 hypothetical protein [Dysgonomonas sp. 521]
MYLDICYNVRFADCDEYSLTMSEDKLFWYMKQNRATFSAWIYKCIITDSISGADVGSGAAWLD